MLANEAAIIGGNINFSEIKKPPLTQRQRPKRCAILHWIARAGPHGRTMHKNLYTGPCKSISEVEIAEAVCEGTVKTADLSQFTVWYDHQICIKTVARLQAPSRLYTGDRQGTEATDFSKTRIGDFIRGCVLECPDQYCRAPFVKPKVAVNERRQGARKNPDVIIRKNHMPVRTPQGCGNEPAHSSVPEKGACSGLDFDRWEGDRHSRRGPVGATII